MNKTFDCSEIDLSFTGFQSSSVKLFIRAAFVILANFLRRVFLTLFFFETVGFPPKIVANIDAFRKSGEVL